MLLRVIKEQFHEDGSPILDMSKPHQPQLINGGTVRIINPKTGAAETYLPGETFEIPDKMGREMLLNSPQTIEPEERHQARLARRKQKDTERESERGALDARIRELDHDVHQAQKLRAMAEQRERELATENLRVQQQSAGQSAQIEELRRAMDEMQAKHAAELAQFADRLKAAPASAATESVAVEPSAPLPPSVPADKASDPAAGLAVTASAADRPAAETAPTERRRGK